MVGREAEIGLARDLFASGHGIVIAGVSGVGKTRLASELSVERAGADTPLVRVVATRSAASIPLGAFGVLVPAGGGPDVQTVNAIVESVRSERAGRGPVILLVDDAHLLDDASAALLHRMVLEGVGVAIMTVRSRQPCPDPVIALWKEGFCRRVELQQLSRAESAQLIAHSLPGIVDPAVVHRLSFLAQGNPLMLRELLRGALDQGVLGVLHGTWTWTGNLSVAPALIDMLTARLSTIDHDARDLLMLLAFAEPLASGPVVEMRGHEPLERLLRAGVIDIDADGYVRIAHPMYGEVVRAELTPPTIARFARELADAHPKPLDDAGAELRRVVWHVDAGALEDPDALLGAIKYAQLHDLDLARRLAAAAVDAGAGIETRLRLADILANLGRLDEADDLLVAMAQEPPDDHTRASIASTRATSLLWLRGDPARALEVLRDAEARIVSPKAVEELWPIRLQALMQEGQVDELGRLVELVLDSSTSSDETKAGALVVGVAAWLLAAQLDVAVERCTVGFETTGRSADAFPVRDLLRYGVALGTLYEGDLDAAEDRFRLLREEVARETDVALRFVYSQGLGRVAMLRGRASEAVGALQEARALVRWAPDLIAWNLGLLAQAQAMAGDADAAQVSVDEARALTTSALFEADRGRADAWIAWTRGERSRAAATALAVADCALDRGQRLPALLSVHDAACFGAAREARERLAPMLDSFPGRLATALAAHVHALDSGDGSALLGASEGLAALGCWRVAAEAAEVAAEMLAGSGLRARADAATRRARELAARAEHHVVDLDIRRSFAQLTAREREVADLAARGGSDRSIARALNLSVRTVETHLHRVYSKLGIEGGRAELRELAEPVEAPTT